MADFIRQHRPTITINAALLSIELLPLQLHTLFLRIASQLQWKMIGMCNVGVLYHFFHGLVR